MAEPVTRKIDTLTLATVVASNDELIVMDVSESAVNMTKRMTMSQIPISLASQLSANVVENDKILDGAVTNSKLGADAVNGTKIADDAVDSEHIKDGAIDLAHMSANSIDSDQYVDGSIDRVHLAADIVDGTKIADNAVGNEHIRDSTAWSVIGRSANTSGDPADISTTTDGYVLRTSGTTLGFGTVSSAGLASGAVTAGKIATGGVSASGQVATNILALDRLVQVTGPAVIGRSANTAGNLAAITSGTDGHVLRQSGTSIGFGTITGAGIANDAVDSQHYAADSIDAEHYAPDSVDYLALKKTAGAEAVTTATIRDGAVTPDKLSIPYIPNAANIELGSLRTSSGSAFIDFHSYYPLNDYDARIIATGGEASTPAKGTLTYYAVSHVFNGDLSVSGEITGAKHVVYMQLFLPDEAIITASGRSQFFVPSYLAGGKVKQLGIGIVSASTPSVTVALGSSYGSVSGTSSTETADTLNYTLPAAMTKIPINVTCGAGTAPKGLDFWFVVLK